MQAALLVVLVLASANRKRLHRWLASGSLQWCRVLYIYILQGPRYTFDALN